MTNLKSIFAPLIVILFFYSCSVNKADIDDSLQSHFNTFQATGCFTLLNNATGEVTVYNLEEDTTRYNAGTSFHTLLSLISLQSGAIASEKSMVHLDSSLINGTTCKSDLSLSEALQIQCQPFFNEMVQRNGQKNIQYWLDTVGFGNKKFVLQKDTPVSFSLPDISADEQLGLMKRLYFELLPFRKSVQAQVKKMMLKEEKALYKLSFLHSESVTKDNKPMEWITGWIEENNHVYFFATLVKRKDKSSEACAESITRSILKQYDFFNGKK